MKNKKSDNSSKTKNIKKSITNSLIKNNSIIPNNKITLESLIQSKEKNIVKIIYNKKQYGYFRIGINKIDYYGQNYIKLNKPNDDKFGIIANIYQISGMVILSSTL